MQKLEGNLAKESAEEGKGSSEQMGRRNNTCRGKIIFSERFSLPVEE